MSRTTVAYISTRCPNCQRFLETVRSIPSLQQTLRIVDIDRTPHPNVEFVPTVVDNKGSVMVGQKVFEWLKQYQSEVEYTPMPLSMGSLSYADLGEGGSLAYADGSYTI